MFTLNYFDWQIIKVYLELIWLTNIKCLSWITSTDKYQISTLNYFDWPRSVVYRELLRLTNISGLPRITATDKYQMSTLNYVDWQISNVYLELFDWQILNVYLKGLTLKKIYKKLNRIWWCLREYWKFRSIK